MRVKNMPTKQVSVFQDESVLEAYKIMSREKIDLIPGVDKEAPTKVVGVLTSEGVAYAHEKAKSLR
jgi:CBS domain-containing protein